jgi:hemerythrin
MNKSKEGGRNNYSYSSESAKNRSPWIALEPSHFLGVLSMDQQHQALVDTLNQLNESVKNNEPDELNALLFDGFLSQIELHFKNEEFLMDKYGYADDSAQERTSAIY